MHSNPTSKLVPSHLPFALATSPPNRVLHTTIRLFIYLSLIFSEILKMLCVYECFARMCLCVPCANLVPMDPRGGQ